jgi:hypothetical protein
VNAALPAELGGLALAALERAGYSIGERYFFDDAPLYRLNALLPPEVPLGGAALLLPETGRYDVITRAVQHLETDPLARGCAFLLAFDPGAVDAPLRQVVRETGTPLSLATRVIGRRFIVQSLLNSAGQ